MNSNNQIPNLFEHIADKTLLQNMDYESYKYYPDKRKKNTLNNNRCITECQLPGRTIYHPNNSIKITEFTGPFCATNSWYDENEHRTKYHDICNFSEGDLLAWSDLDTTKLIPYGKEKCSMLLSSMHNINSINDALKWASTTLHSDDTKKRILNCAWKVYNLEDIDTKDIVKNIVKNYQNILLDNWLEYIYGGLNRYYSPELKKEQVIDKIKMMLNDRKLIMMILKSYTKKNRIDWLTLNYYNEDIKLFFVNELKTIIQ